MVGKFSSQNSKVPQRRIIIPGRTIQAGLETKFEYSPKKVKGGLHNLLSPKEYKDAIVGLNDYLKRSRSSPLVDGMLLATGPLMIPLAVWSIRHKKQIKLRKKLLQEAIHEFNDTHETLWMKYMKRSNGNILTIEERKPHHRERKEQQIIHKEDENDDNYALV